MPLTKLGTETLSRFCANCGAEHDVALADVKVALADELPSEALCLPACSECQSIELLLPTREGNPLREEGGYGHLHQLLVDELQCRLGLASEGRRAGSLENLSKWFPKGLELPKPSTFDATPQASSPAKVQRR